MAEMTRSRMARLRLAVLLPMAASGAWALAAEDAVYRRVEPEGGAVLTNVPDTSDYELLVAGSKPSTPAPVKEAKGAAAPLAPPEAALAALRDVARAQDRQELARRDTPAQPVLPDEPEVARSKAEAVAGQAFQDITSAGGASQRLQALYEASRAATAAQRQQQPAERSR